LLIVDPRSLIPSFSAHTPVTAVTDSLSNFGETAIVIIGSEGASETLFEPGDTRQQWKGEAAARFV